MRPFLVHAIVPLAVLSLVACGDDDSPPADDSIGDESSGDASDGDVSDGDTLTDPSEPTGGDGALTTLDAQDICDAVTADIVADALGTEVESAEPSTSGTQQCAYVYGGGSNVTVASLSADEVGGAGGDAAFDRVLEINRSVAGGTDVDEAEVDAGDRAVRLTGGSLHLGIVSVDDLLLTVIAPPADFDAEQFEALLVAVGAAA